MFKVALKTILRYLEQNHLSTDMPFLRNNTKYIKLLTKVWEGSAMSFVYITTKTLAAFMAFALITIIFLLKNWSLTNA